MATPTFLTGWEHGVINTGGGGLVNDFANASISSTTRRSGSYALRLNPSAAVAYWEKTADGGVTSNVLVARLYVRFAVLPNASVVLFHDDNSSTEGGVGFNVGDVKFCTYLDGAFATGGGPVVSTNTWYRLDVRIDSSTGTFTVDAQVDGSSVPQSSGAYGSATFNAYKVGPNSHTSTMDCYVDDLIVSHTSADYPLGEGYIKAYSPNAVGTHNLEASPSSAFFRDEGGSETAIANGETASWANINDVPLTADDDHVLVENDASLTTAHYLEYAFANSDEASIQAVRGIVTMNQDSAVAANFQARLREGGSDATITNQTAWSTSSRDWFGMTFATKPSGGAWTDSSFDATTLRWGFTADADGRVRLESAMLEAAFSGSETGGGGGGASGVARMMTMGLG